MKLSRAAGSGDYSPEVLLITQVSQCVTSSFTHIPSNPQLGSKVKNLLWWSTTPRGTFTHFIIYRMKLKLKGFSKSEELDLFKTTPQPSFI